MGIDTGLNTVSQMEGAAGTAAGAANTALNVLDAAHSVLLAFGYHVELELQYEPMDVPQAIHLREDPKHVAGRQMWP
ncbi:MAG: hypothetical protein QME92_04170 [Bacillota bacterium]|nr:hypothetical protein [Bacillota bacterium]